MTSEVKVNGRKSGPVKTSYSVAAKGFFGMLITNIMLVLITDDVFMHLGQVGSGQVRSTSKGIRSRWQPPLTAS